ncbi:PREDICTED: subtilisin-like protease SBT5.3 [Prunus mume]|uniref:Subtilisin-like protease SBT5.3 n=1 Tax=Prunus mume TaxID=102107 RepID=A0ABM1LNK7_PRUMU|nr:PREDICTED: subtilisin-like protease SBT5.3 [Prunus mume]
MRPPRPTIALYLLSFLLSPLALHRPTFAIKKSYVVYLGSHSHPPNLSELELNQVRENHYEFLGSFLGSHEVAKESIFYSYTKHINGFAATLEEEEAAQIAKHPKVVSIFLNQGRKLHTTRSWDFLGLEHDGVTPPNSIWNKARYGEDTIIGNLDTGAWPESNSFSDEEYGPIPSKWKGICQNETDSEFYCNRKLIGARYYNKGYAAAAGTLNSSFDSPRDNEGHGSHTLSTAGGNFVTGASVFGFGNGTAKGGSPKARVAAYKVCWPPVNGNQCFEADILAAFDIAIHDGVDVLSVSLGGYPSAFFNDSVAIGAFHAVKHGIVVVCSAGNSGPAEGTVSNVAPWQITVGASTIDREFPSYVTLGNWKHFRGQSLSPVALPGKRFYRLISAADAKAANASVQEALLCKAGTLDLKKVKGKILACLRGDSARVDKGEQALLAGAVGMILANDELSGNEIISDPHVLPASHINFTDGALVFAYINSTKSPRAYIKRPTTQLGTKPAPVMAAFSSKGPNTITPDILKPDITAPGVSIIAAYTEAQGPTNQMFDKRRVLFNSVSGTSMSCPHISGICGLLKTLYPHWSPAAIKSAIMTTGKNTLIHSSHLFLGKEHRPSFLIAYECPKPAVSLTNLNYPSITVPKLNGSLVVTRTVKNVGTPGTYKARIQNPDGISVSVEPNKLEFKKIGEEKSFKLLLQVIDAKAAKNYVFGKLIWSDGKHYVRSPIVVKAA